jgi:spore coat protein U-like protein
VITAGSRRWIVRVAGACAVLLAHAVAPNEAGAACTISATAVNFGTYDVFAAAPDDSVGTVTYRCGNADHNVAITLSTGGSGSYAARQLRPASGADRLNYNLYRDAARSSVWGDGSGGTTYYFIGNPPNNVNVNLSIYGRIAASQDVAIGTYTDTIVVTVNF